MLLRLTPALDALRFDGVALMDLGGSGIRELAARDGTLWGIAGPPAHDPGPHEVWRVPLADLAPGARLTPGPARVRVPGSSEGMAFDGAGAIIVIDGDRGDPTEHSCKVPGRQLRVDLP
jgi:hypothetical protein